MCRRKRFNTPGDRRIGERHDFLRLHPRQSARTTRRGMDFAWPVAGMFSNDGISFNSHERSSVRWQCGQPPLDRNAAEMRLGTSVHIADFQNQPFLQRETPPIVCNRAAGIADPR